MSADHVWFSHREERWKVGFFGRFSWTGKFEVWDFDRCTLSLARAAEDKRLVGVVRSSTTVVSEYMGKRPVGVRFMLNFDIKGEPPEPRTETYIARENIPKKKEGPRTRWVLQLDDDHWIWEWATDGSDISSSRVYRFYRELRNEIEHPSKGPEDVFNVRLDRRDDRLIPVVYQPSIDSLKNFVREVQCARGPVASDGSRTVDVTIVFNNERLRKHGVLNTIWEAVRVMILYGRKMDVESFEIHLGSEPAGNSFTFKGIYSGRHGMNDDRIHGDKPPPPAPKHQINYYFAGIDHPVVFVNTSNHAMGERDANRRLWKWEYVPWLEDAPVRLGDETREQVEKRLTL